MENIKHPIYKCEITGTKCLNNMQKKNRFIKVKNSLLELENSFIGLKDGKLKDRELKIKK